MGEKHGDKADPFADGAAKGKGSGFVTGLLSGAIAGGATGLLFTPLKGEEARERGRQKAPELMSLAAAKMGVFQPADVLTRIKGAFSAVKERLRDAAQEAKEGISEGEEEAQHRYESMVRRRRRGSRLL
ncbi:MAG: YtxH domain-containing protein [Dehalococcoidia bacterium]|jgi:gas vesicle protein